MKLQTVFICSKCDAQTPKWAGRCFECGEWGSLREEVRSLKTEAGKSNSQLLTSSFPTAAAIKPIALNQMTAPKAPRIKTGINEFDRVLGGGIPAGSVILLSGEPGIGKSTLLAQVCGAISKKSGAVLYTSGEESAEQVHGRFARVGAVGASVLFLQETDAATLAATIEAEKPAIAVIDSVNTLRGPSGKSGTPAEVKSSAAIIAESAKRSSVPVILVGQIRKDGEVAGPKALEHIVDVVLSLEGDPQHSYRILRASKNRFGSIDEVGVFAQTSRGLEEVSNPSSLFLTENAAPNPGSAITALLEGVRPILCEIQALTHKSSFGYPQRRSTGIDPHRFNLVLAVLARRAGFRLDYTDVHVNVSGGLKIHEPAADLALALSIASAYQNRPINKQMLALGEISLSGEIRSVKDMERRLREAQKLGFTHAIVPFGTKKEETINILETKDINQALEIIA